MPLVRIETTPILDSATASALAARLSPVVARTIGKPERYVMVLVAGATALCMSGAEGPAAFVDVRSIGGLGGTVNGTLCRAFSAALFEVAGIAPERVFATFTEFDAASWGHGADTLG